MVKYKYEVIECDLGFSEFQKELNRFGEKGYHLKHFYFDSENGEYIGIMEFREEIKC